MADVCAVPKVDDPLFQSLLGSTDCVVQGLVQSSYATLASGVLAGLITAALTIYVAVLGYQLLLGRSQLMLSDLVLSALKIGAILALTTQWPLYEELVYNLMFHGPEQLADLIRLDTGAKLQGGGLIAALQHAFDDLNLFSPLAPPGATHHDPNAAASLPTWQIQNMSPAARDASLLLISGVVLMLSTIGVLLCAKLVLGIFLAPGPLFVGFLMFASTRGIFAGWLRASVAASLLALFTSIAIGFALALLQPVLANIEQMDVSNTYIPGVGMRAFVLVMVTAFATFGLAAGAAIIAMGFKLPVNSVTRLLPVALPGTTRITASVQQSRAASLAAALAVQDRSRSTEAGPLNGRAGSGLIMTTESQSTTRSEVRRRIRPSNRPR